MPRDKNYPRKRKPAKGKRKYNRKRKLAAKGALWLRRKTAPMQISSSSTLGVPTLTDPTGTCITLGIPTSVPGATSTYNIPFSMKFRLDQLVNSSEVSNLFDKYRINNVWVRLHNNVVNQNGGFAQPWLEYYKDTDDNAVPTVLSMAQKMGVRTKFFTAARNFIDIGVKPLPAPEVFASGAATGYMVPKYAPFLNMSNTGIEHYGIKGIIHNVYLPAVANQYLTDFDLTFDLTLRDVQ